MTTKTTEETPDKTTDTADEEIPEIPDRDREIIGAIETSRNWREAKDKVKASKNTVAAVKKKYGIKYGSKIPKKSTADDAEENMEKRVSEEVGQHYLTQHKGAAVARAMGYDEDVLAYGTHIYDRYRHIAESLGIPTLKYIDDAIRFRDSCEPLLMEMRSDIIGLGRALEERDAIIQRQVDGLRTRGLITDTLRTCIQMAMTEDRELPGDTMLQAVRVALVLEKEGK